VPQNHKIEFINRLEELKALRERIPPNAKSSTLTFLRSPSGYGKTRLTDRLVESISPEGPSCVVVDPAIRSKSRSDRVYACFFVQRAAEPSSLRKRLGRREFRTFPEFLRRSHLWKINWRHASENLKAVVSLSNLAKFLIDLGENILKTGRYRPDALLQDDSTFATRLAADYVLALVTYRPTIIIVRECQNIDAVSLAFFLALAEDSQHCFVFFEYTSNDNSFASDHEKIIFDNVTSWRHLVIFDLLRLNLADFRYLLRQYAKTDDRLEVAAVLAWDGNLRIIRELQYRVMLGSSVDSSAPIHLASAIARNLESLKRKQQLILALVVAHVEAIEIDTILVVLQRMHIAANANTLGSDVATLANDVAYLKIRDRHVSLSDEDLLEGLLSSPTMTPLLAIAEAALRDLYLDLIDGATFTSTPLHLAIRQAIALCARTGDIVALRRLLQMLDSTVRLAYDQTLYLNPIVAKVDAESGFKRPFRGRLCNATAHLGQPGLRSSLGSPGLVVG
jgi:hypothetical protein